MSRLLKLFSTKRRPGGVHPLFRLLTVVALLCFPTAGWTQELAREGRESIRISVVAVNPSEAKTQKVPVKMYLPAEVTPEDIVNLGGLKVDFDTENSTYFLYGEDIQLKPKEIRTFTVELRDAWIVKKERIEGLRNQAQSMIDHLEGTPDHEAAMQLGDAINKALATVEQTQNDETVSTKRHIGIYRSNLKIIEQVKEDIVRLEKQASLSASPPIPDVLENSKVKADAPTKNTTWMIIFIIMAFMGLMAGAFFVTWYAQAHFAKNSISTAKDSAFPRASPSSGKDKK